HPPSAISAWLGGADMCKRPRCGAGGAGAFSDGKLSTGVKDRRIPWILTQLVEAGAPADILTDAKPHIGTDLLPGVCAGLRRRIIALGGEVRFSTRVTGLAAENGRLTAAETNRGLVPCQTLILACGHSARDTFEMLCRLNIPMSPKPFAMGVRIEHLQRDIDKAQYGPFAGHPRLPAADYSLACQLPNGRRCYTFCMCPGGEVVPAASEEGRVCTNGASPRDRNYENANAALLAAVAPADFPYPGVLGGMEWQRAMERAAYDAAGGGYLAPCQTVGGFLTGRETPVGKVSPSYAPGVRGLNLRALLPPVIGDTLAGALPLFGHKLRGFDESAAVLTGPETRSSSPVRMERGADLQSPALRGLYPCGEGAGWAGGIISAALDGLRCAQALLETLEDR
ncbi:MAG: FAD-dependent oxidoreductase, partial [Oscillospiraceae bacterium]|nr:FAD-dependent oxidoreductase [Oscillospiraceae bacterium]